MLLAVLDPETGNLDIYTLHYSEQENNENSESDFFEKSLTKEEFIEDFLERRYTDINDLNWQIIEKITFNGHLAKIEGRKW